MIENLRDVAVKNLGLVGWHHIQHSEPPARVEAEFVVFHLFGEEIAWRRGTKHLTRVQTAEAFLSFSDLLVAIYHPNEVPF